MTVSYWRQTTRLGTLTCDCLVIGAGICGISAALHLSRRSQRVIVVEKDRLGSGASTRNAGFLMRGCADNYALAVKDFGRQRAKSLWQLTEANLAGLRREGIEQLPGTRNIPSVLTALREDEHQLLLESARLMREDGFDVDLLTSHSPLADALWNFAKPHAGLVNPQDASCHSREVLELLRSKLTGDVLEGQEVFALYDDGAWIVAHTSDATIRARAVLACTNAYAPLLLPGLDQHITPHRGQLLALRPSPGRNLSASYYLNFGSEYVRQHADGVILVGGCRTYHAQREVGYEDRTTPWVQADLEAFAARVLGPIDPARDVCARWAGTMGFSKTHLPLIGPAWGPNSANGRVWFCGGFTGHGMSMAYRVSEIAVAALLDGVQNPFPLTP